VRDSVLVNDTRLVQAPTDLDDAAARLLMAVELAQANAL
jgi:hypothetical protein